MQSEQVRFRREVKSYMLRTRMTPSQAFAFRHYWPLYGVDIDFKEKLDLAVLFERQAPLLLEIGFGMGDCLLSLAENYPHLNFLGIEVHKPGIGALLSKIQEKSLSNIRIICYDAVTVLASLLPNNCLSGVLLFFPDPWPKRRHHPRRIVQPAFVDHIYKKLQEGGFFHLATDVEEYATHMLNILTAHDGFAILNNQDAKLLQRPKTKFERRGEALGHPITDLVFMKRSRG